MELIYLERLLNNKKNLDKIRESSLELYRRNVTIFMNKLEQLKKIHDEIILANSITRNDVEDYINFLMKQYAESYVNNIITSLKLYFDYLFDEQELIERNPFGKIKQIKNPTKVNVKDYLELKEIKSIIKETYIRKRGERGFELNSSRTRALISILANNGLRIEELLRLKESNLEIHEDYYLIYYKADEIKNHVNKKSIIYGNSKIYFDEYMEIKKELFPNSDYIFVSIKGKQFTSKNSQETLQKYADRCGIKKHITNHVFREVFRTYNTNIGINENIIRLIGGWSIDKVSESYIRSLDIQTLKKVCNII